MNCICLRCWTLDVIFTPTPSPRAELKTVAITWRTFEKVFVSCSSISSQMFTARAHQWSTHLRSSLQVFVFIRGDVGHPVQRAILDRNETQQLSGDHVPRQWNLVCPPSMHGYDQRPRQGEKHTGYSHWVVISVCICFVFFISEVLCSSERPTGVRRWSIRQRQQVRLRDEAQYECSPDYERTDKSSQAVCTRDGWSPDPLCRGTEVNLRNTPVAGTNLNCNTFDVLSFKITGV